MLEVWAVSSDTAAAALVVYCVVTKLTKGDGPVTPISRKATEQEIRVGAALIIYFITAMGTVVLFVASAVSAVMVLWGIWRVGTMNFPVFLCSIVGYAGFSVFSSRLLPAAGATLGKAITDGIVSRIKEVNKDD